jgi:hypothetical protein
MTSINVSQRTQMIVVDVASRSVSVINAGPVGPAGPMGEVTTSQLNTALSGKQPLDSDLTALAGLATTAWGRQVLTLADSAAALTYLGAGTAATKDVPASGNASSSQVVKGDDTRLQAAADLTSHVALKNAHGVTRELRTFVPQTPPHIPGNLLTHDQQRGISGWSSFGGSSVHAPTGGPDDGGEQTVTASSTSLFGMNGEYIAGAPGDVRTYTIRFRASEAVASGDVYVPILFFNSSFDYISSSYALPVVAAGVDSTVTVTTPLGGAPAGTAWIGVQIYRFTGHTVGSTLSASVACLRTSPTIPGSSGVAGWGGNSDCIKVVAGEMVISKSGDSYGGAYMTELFVPPVSANHRRITTMIRYMGLPERELYIRSSWPYYADARHILLGGDKNLTLIHEITAGQTASAMIHEIAIFNGVAANGEQYILSPLNVEWSTYS